MTLGDWLLGLMTVECALAAGAYFYAGNFPYALAFIGYTCANTGLFIASITR